MMAFEDIFITYYSHNVLYRNLGDGTFTDVTMQATKRLPLKCSSVRNARRFPHNQVRQNPKFMLTVIVVDPFQLFAQGSDGSPR